MEDVQPFDTKVTRFHCMAGSYLLIAILFIIHQQFHLKNNALIRKTTPFLQLPLSSLMYKSYTFIDNQSIIQG